MTRRAALQAARAHPTATIVSDRTTVIFRLTVNCESAPCNVSPTLAEEQADLTSVSQNSGEGCQNGKTIRRPGESKFRDLCCDDWSVRGGGASSGQM